MFHYNKTTSAAKANYEKLGSSLKDLNVADFGILTTRGRDCVLCSGKIAGVGVDHFADGRATLGHKFLGGLSCLEGLQVDDLGN